MYRDSEGQIHVLLALDRDGGDGILIDSQGHDYARYTAFMPNIKAYIEEQISIAAEQIIKEAAEQIIKEAAEQIIKEAAEQIIKEAAENSSNGSWAIYYDEIEENQGLIVKEYNGIGTMLLDELHRREEIAEIEIEDECFDITLYLDYCINLDEEIKQGQNMKM